MYNTLYFHYAIFVSNDFGLHIRQTPWSVFQDGSYFTIFAEIVLNAQMNHTYPLPYHPNKYDIYWRQYNFIKV